MEWRPEKYPYHVVLAQRDRGLTTVSMIVLDEFTELAPIEEAELDPPASRAPRAGATQWTQTYSNANDAFNGYTAIAYPPPFRPAKSYKSRGGHAPNCAPPSSDNPCPHQLCLVHFAPAVQRARHIDTIREGTEARQNLQT